MAYKDSLLSSVLTDTQKSNHNSEMLDSVVVDQLEVFGKEKMRIKSSMMAK